MKNTLIKLEEVWKNYQIGDETVHALSGIDLSINENEFVVIVGPSGSGKSTLMNLVGCLDIPSTGCVKLTDKDITKMDSDELAVSRGKKIGFVFQKFNLINNLTALQNIMLPMIFQNSDPDKRKKRAEELLEFVGLNHRMEHKPTQLSGGEQQRVAIARALANNPDIILADEPTGNLDSTTGKKIMALFQDLHKKGKTIIFVTHDNELTKYAEKIITIRDGKVINKVGKITK